MGATIRIGQGIQCLPYAGVLANIYQTWKIQGCFTNTFVDKGSLQEEKCAQMQKIIKKHVPLTRTF